MMLRFRKGRKRISVYFYFLLCVTIFYFSFLSIYLDGVHYSLNNTYGKVDNQVEYVVSTSNKMYTDTIKLNLDLLSQEKSEVLNWVTIYKHLEKSGKKEISYQSLYMAYLLSTNEEQIDAINTSSINPHNEKVIHLSNFLKVRLTK